MSTLSRMSLRIRVRPLRSASAPGVETTLGAVVVVLFALVALAAPLLAPYDPHAFSGQPLERPSPAHPLGTNDAGQDILSELLYGARISLAAGLGAALGTVALGLLVGAIAGYAGGPLDLLLMRLVDVMLTLPRLPFLILLAAFLGSGLVQTMTIISLLFWPATARVIRAQVQSQRQRGYVRMARNFGAGTGYVLRRHILPSIAPLIAFGLVAAAGRAVAMEAGLAFLGLGDPTAKSWGLMMRFALNLPGLLLTDRWLWWLLPPGLCITLLILALSYLGMGLEERWQPRLRRR
ncbi:MAG: ABC transporter permease [Anaerolineae bacterium]|nr:ABC transporter permease [Anaerolineae bacterium]